MDIENQASKTDIIDSESHLPPCKTRIPIGLYLIFTLVSISSFVYVIFTRPKVDDEWLKVTVCVVIFIWMGRCATWAFGFNGINSNLCYVTGLLFLSSWCLVMCLVGAVMIKMMGSRALYPTKFWTEELFLSNDVFAWLILFVILQLHVALCFAIFLRFIFTEEQNVKNVVNLKWVVGVGLSPMLLPVAVAFWLLVLFILFLGGPGVSTHFFVMLLLEITDTSLFIIKYFSIKFVCVKFVNSLRHEKDICI